MDSGVFLTARDRHANKPSKMQKFNQGEDIISKLPDDIIVHILSFLSYKDAIRTSVLSQRWIYMWTYLTTLYLKDKATIRASYQIKTSFINFVCRLLHRLNASSISKFYLSLSEKYDPYIFSELTSLVSNQKVKEICLISLQECNISCYPIFKCQSLEKLVLCLGLSIIQFPSFVCLSSLTVLRLTSIRDPMKITCYSSNQSKELTLKFPVLKDYYSCDCIWLGVKRVTIEAPLLEEVKIVRQWFMTSNVSQAEIEIRASSITEYSYSSYISSETTLLNAAHIADASISLSDSNVEKTGEQMQIFVRKLFNINNLKCLRVFLDLAPMKHYLAGIHTFEVLTYLHLYHPVTIKNLLVLLLKSPCLETLVLQRVIDSKTEPPNFAMVPECFLSTLKVVRLEKFAGAEQEFSFANFVMEKSQFLESISFSCYKLSGEEIEKVKERIFLVKRSFNIEFSAHSVT
ncbi:F-box/FBD/LRR-repeat protein At3g14710-like [Vicia villosa]|uniref:F-box/FBD/LRR-repeat protein At3g14710-like n=1 Tax=Vicia villosa TaxID=3911 RepID=UPI00273C8C41|nr:F-box/FBD/LRR-repeat protein At3g14710-like [Vicia villosa]